MVIEYCIANSLRVIASWYVRSRAEFQQGEVGANHTASEKCPRGSPTGSTLLQRGKRSTQVPTEVSETQQTGSHQPRCRQCTQL